ncbi:hypothetical protein Tco_0445634 [Tanacetum coccineum]
MTDTLFWKVLTGEPKVKEWYEYGHLEEIVVKRADQQLYTFKEVNLRMFARRTVIQARVEDLQLGVESYQKKLNLTNPRTRDVDMSRRPVYTTLSDPQVTRRLIFKSFFDSIGETLSYWFTHTVLSALRQGDSSEFYLIIGNPDGSRSWFKTSQDS